MAVPSGDYRDDEYGCSTGGAIIVCVSALIFMMYMLVSKVNQADKVHKVQKLPNKEIQINIDTCQKITDTFNIKTR